MQVPPSRPTSHSTPACACMLSCRLYQSFQRHIRRLHVLACLHAGSAQPSDFPFDAKCLRVPPAVAAYSAALHSYTAQAFEKAPGMRVCLEMAVQDRTTCERGALAAGTPTRCCSTDLQRVELYPGVELHPLRQGGMTGGVVRATSAEVRAGSKRDAVSVRRMLLKGFSLFRGQDCQN
eukprot:359186-Chlamydomonas_euryale.AAC.4